MNQFLCVCAVNNMSVDELASYTGSLASRCHNKGSTPCLNCGGFLGLFNRDLMGNIAAGLKLSQHISCLADKQSGVGSTEVAHVT